MANDDENDITPVALESLELQDNGKFTKGMRRFGRAFGALAGVIYTIAFSVEVFVGGVLPLWLAATFFVVTGIATLLVEIYISSSTVADLFVSLAHWRHKRKKAKERADKATGLSAEEAAQVSKTAAKVKGGLLRGVMLLNGVGNAIFGFLQFYGFLSGAGAAAFIVPAFVSLVMLASSIAFNYRFFKSMIEDLSKDGKEETTYDFTLSYEGLSDRDQKPALGEIPEFIEIERALSMKQPPLPADASDKDKFDYRIIKNILQFPDDFTQEERDKFFTTLTINGRRVVPGQNRFVIKTDKAILTIYLEDDDDGHKAGQYECKPRGPVTDAGKRLRNVLGFTLGTIITVWTVAGFPVLLAYMPSLAFWFLAVPIGLCVFGTQLMTNIGGMEEYIMSFKRFHTPENAAHNEAEKTQTEKKTVAQRLKTFFAKKMPVLLKAINQTAFTMIAVAFLGASIVFGAGAMPTLPIWVIAGVFGLADGIFTYVTVGAIVNDITTKAEEKSKALFADTIVSLTMAGLAVSLSALMFGFSPMYMGIAGAVAYLMSSALMISKLKAGRDGTYGKVAAFFARLMPKSYKAKAILSTSLTALAGIAILGAFLSTHFTPSAVAGLGLLLPGGTAGLAIAITTLVVVAAITVLASGKLASWLESRGHKKDGPGDGSGGDDHDKGTEMEEIPKQRMVTSSSSASSASEALTLENDATPEAVAKNRKSCLKIC